MLRARSAHWIAALAMSWRYTSGRCAAGCATIRSASHMFQWRRPPPSIPTQVHPDDITGDRCGICGRGDEHASDWISCDGCNTWVHFSCDERMTRGAAAAEGAACSCQGSWRTSCCGAGGSLLPARVGPNNLAHVRQPCLHRPALQSAPSRTMPRARAARTTAPAVPRWGKLWT